MPYKKKKVINYIFIKKIVYGTMDGHSINIYIYIYKEPKTDEVKKKKKLRKKRKKKKNEKSEVKLVGNRTLHSS